MLLTLFICIVNARKPVILIPCFYGTNLWVSYNKTNLPWYCPQEENDTLLWIGAKYALPHNMNCFFKLMSTFLNEKKEISNWPNTTISIHDFGGDESNRHVFSFQKFNLSVVVTYANIVDSFKSKGWILKKDLFVAPYDWRIAPTYSEEYYAQLKKLVEDAYKQNNNTKVTLFGFSLGGFMAQQFLAKFADQEWKDKFISQAILLSPSFTGTGDNVYNMWVKRIPFVPWIKTESLDFMLESMPVCQVHMPNEFIFQNETIIYGPDGEEYKAPDLYYLLKNKTIFRKEFDEMYEKSEIIMREAPHDLGVNTTLLFNSAIKTTVKLNFSNGWDGKPVKIKGEGDGTVLSKGLKWACKNWTRTRCFDFNNPNKEFQHQPMISNDYVLDIISNITENYFSYNDIIKQDKIGVQTFDDL